MNIRILQETDAPSYQELRLNGLMRSPEAFGSTYEREADFSIETVRERIKPSQDKFVLGAFDDKGALMGIVAFMRDSGVKTSHKGHVFGMYVREEKRGQGIGKMLMLELIEKAQEAAGLERILLSVVTSNEAAKKLYFGVGFQTYGLERQALKYEGQYWDEELMALELKPGAGLQ